MLVVQCQKHLFSTKINLYAQTCPAFLLLYTHLMPHTEAPHIFSNWSISSARISSHLLQPPQVMRFALIVEMTVQRRSSVAIWLHHGLRPDDLLCFGAAAVLPAPVSCCSCFCH